MDGETASPLPGRRRFSVPHSPLIRRVPLHLLPRGEKVENPAIGVSKESFDVTVGITRE